MRVAIIGGGSIARLFLDHIRGGDLGEGVEVVAIAGRSAGSRGKSLADEYGVAFASGLAAVLAQRPDVVVEAASHEAVREYAEPLLSSGVAVIVLSGGALHDDALRGSLESAARRTGALLYVPSGGIGGLDALKAACIAGVDEVGITVSKPPQAWKNIAYVEKLGVALAAALSMAGIGFDRTRLRVVADPGITHNTHLIEIRGRTGNITIKLENVPAPDNPKTAWLACYSALAALKLAKSPIRYGT
jgi:aspartate dehydrogenase